MRPLNLFSIAAVTVLSIAACGGTTPAATTAPMATQPAQGATPGSVPTQGVSATQPAGSTPAPVGNVDACSLLTPEELSSAFGETYGDGSLDSVGQCSWNLEGEFGNTGHVVVVYINPEKFSTVQGLLGIQEGSVDLSVSGHAAFYNPNQGLGSLWVDIGDAGTFVVSFPQSEDLDPSYQDIAVQLAETALSKM